MTNAIAAFGIQLQMGNGASPEVFTAIAELKDYSGPALSMETLDATNHGSANNHEEILASIKRSGEITFDVQYVPTGATHDATSGLLKKYNDRTKTNFKLVFPDTGATTWSFSAFVTGFQPNAPVLDVLTASVTIKIDASFTLV